LILKIEEKKNKKKKLGDGGTKVAHWAVVLAEQVW